MPVTCFSISDLDRADHLRSHPDLMASTWLGADARVAVIVDGKAHTDADGRLVWWTTEALPAAHTVIFLGLLDGAPRYAADLVQSPEVASDTRLRDGRVLAFKLGFCHSDLGVFAQMKSMLSWHRSHKFCSACGQPSRLAKGGYERRCDACATSHFPRTDPVVIMLAVHKDRALVGRGHGLPPGMYSALAGFMEPGETIEAAVARELFEEAGVRATSVRYVASQPWPWPSSLMIGTIAEVDDDTIVLDETELEDARWITREQAAEALVAERGQFALPPPFAIAHNLVKEWLRRV